MSSRPDPRRTLAKPTSRLSMPGTTRTTVTVTPGATGTSKVFVRTSLPSTSVRGASTGRAVRPAANIPRTGPATKTRSISVDRPASGNARPRISAALPRTSAASLTTGIARPTTSTTRYGTTDPHYRRAPTRPSTGNVLPSAKIILSTSRSAGAVSSKSKASVKGKEKKESALKKFDRCVGQELKRRRDDVNVLVAATSSDPNLLEAVDHLERAEAAHCFAGAVQAAEEAAASAQTLEQAEEAAAARARSFETELIDVVEESVPGLKPIQVIGYVGITRPTKAKR